MRCNQSRTPPSQEHSVCQSSFVRSSPLISSFIHSRYSIYTAASTINQSPLSWSYINNNMSVNSSFFVFFFKRGKWVSSAAMWISKRVSVDTYSLSQHHHTRSCAKGSCPSVSSCRALNELLRFILLSPVFCFVPFLSCNLLVFYYLWLHSQNTDHVRKDKLSVVAQEQRIHHTPYGELVVEACLILITIHCLVPSFFLPPSGISCLHLHYPVLLNIVPTSEVVVNFCLSENH